ncbi:MAG TPA: PIN domain-containing protein [Hanamia sp.]|nr:PIN domain-containing protein [Hanamia sp.]
MNDKIFFDTNVILYSYSDKPEPKKEIAKTIILNSDGIISTQVMQEMCNVLIKKLKQDNSSVSKTLAELNNNFFVFINNIKTINKALEVHFKYQFSYYDSLIIASALENKCSVLYSEDLQHSQKIESSLTIINPFI